MASKKERDEKKEIYAMDLIAIESAGIREELRKIQLDAHETCLEVGASRHALECICRELKRLNDFLRAAKSFEIKQIGGSGMAITGIVKGQTGTFTETPLPAGGALQAGNIPVWTSDDSLTTLTPSADGTSVAVATSASDPATQFNLTVSGVASDGTAISSTAIVPLTPSAVVPATGFDINQTA